MNPRSGSRQGEIRLPSPGEAGGRTGTAISFETQGTGPVPVLLLHGFAASRSTWDDLRTWAPDERCTLYLIDLPGFGNSSKLTDGMYDPVSQAETVLALMISLGLEDAVVIGHSLGGTIALLAAVLAGRSVEQCRLVKALVLIGAPAWPQRLPRFFRYLRLPFIGTLPFRILPTRLIVTRALASVYYDPGLIDERHIRRYAGCFRGNTTIRALIRTVRQLVPKGWEDYAGRYRFLHGPLLLIWGRQDRVVPLTQGERLRDTVPGARLVVIDRCGHNPHEEFPGETWHAIARFLDTL